jgi:hypothetical protein
VRIGFLLAALLAFLACLAPLGCAGGAAPGAGAKAAAAESLASSVRNELTDRFRPKATLTYGRFADPMTGDSVAGYVVRVSAPFDMVDRDTLPHEWLRERLRAGGWGLEDEADGPGGSSYRAVRASRRLVVVATWEDLHEPVEEPDWYAVTVAVPSARANTPGSDRAAP